MTYIRNTGPMEVTIAQADINDRIYPAAIEPGKTLSKLSQAKVIIPFPWNKGEPYEVGITTSDGIRFSKKVEVARASTKSEYTTGVYVCNNRYSM